MQEWLRTPEWKYLLSLLTDDCDAAQVDLVNADANDRAKIGRIQAAIKIYHEFLSGYVGESLVEDVRQAEILRKENG